MKILIVNIGSTSFKYQLLQMSGETILARGNFERVGEKKSPMANFTKELGWERGFIPTTKGYDDCIRYMLNFLQKSKVVKDIGEIEGIGFKSPHGGEIRQAVLIDNEVLKKMEEYFEVVPAHNPPTVKAMERFMEIVPQTPLIAVFETGFHSQMPEYASIYSIPYQWYSEHQIKRYGFHGASHRYVSTRAEEILAKSLKEMKVISCHLGGSSSVTAIKEGFSIENSMGFSTQAGLPMSNRSGDIDPFVIPFIMKKEKMTFEAVMEKLVKNSGLLGISEHSGDMRDLLSKPECPKAQLAVESFCYHVKKFIGSYIPILGGLSVLIFTGGIGERSPEIRKRICEGFSFLGMALDGEKNFSQEREKIISLPSSKVKILVIPTNEEIIVARETAKVLKDRQI